MNETSLYHQVRDYVHGVGGFILKIHGGLMQQSGVPDVYICHGGLSMWIELKVGNNDTSLKQKLVMKKMMKAGCFCAVLRWKDGVYEVMGEHFASRELSTAIEYLEELATNCQNVSYRK